MKFGKTIKITTLALGAIALSRNAIAWNGPEGCYGVGLNLDTHPAVGEMCFNGNTVTGEWINHGLKHNACQVTINGSMTMPGQMSHSVTLNVTATSSCLPKKFGKVQIELEPSTDWQFFYILMTSPILDRQSGTMTWQSWD
jgi:hypothetical protein